MRTARRFPNKPTAARFGISAQSQKRVFLTKHNSHKIVAKRTFRLDI